jgi:hypothetical protein
MGDVGHSGHGQHFSVRPRVAAYNPAKVVSRNK